MTLKEAMNKNGWTPSQVATFAGTSKKTLALALEKGTTTSVKLIDWCDVNRIDLGHPIITSHGDRGRTPPTPFNGQIAHMHRVKKGQLVVNNHECDMFRKTIKGTRISVEVSCARPCSVVYDFEVVG